MTGDRGFNSDWRRAAEHVYSYLESEWSKGNQLRIEDVLPLVPRLVGSFDVDPSDPTFMNEVMAELICLEMDLRFANGLEINPAHFRRRFSGFDKAVDEAFERVNELAQGDPTLPPQAKPSFAYDQVARVTQPMPSGPDEVFIQGENLIPSELGRFKSLKKLGNGEFGIVCSAYDTVNERGVALKFPRKSVLSNRRRYQMFLDEAKLATKLDHPGIVRTYGVEQIEGYLVIVQQLVAGTNLSEAKSQYLPVPGEDSESALNRWRRICELIAKIADALTNADVNDVYHRDLKPANIMIDQDGNPLIADFGLALDGNAQLWTEDSICGTISYMCPEATLGQTWLMNGRSDIWSLGVIFYNLMTGEMPFPGILPEDCIRLIRKKEPKSFRVSGLSQKIPTKLEAICDRCLEKSPKSRYKSGDELAEDLREWIHASSKFESVPDDPTEEKKPEILPKGLQSYGPQDANFFLSMLPGPRDPNDIPASIRFWKVRIKEPVARSNRVPVGVIYGPSGSGKSSFMKAGLLPQLADEVTHVYVESAQGHTDARLIKALRREFTIPDGLNLIEVLQGLRQGKWQEDGKKILIVLDQFEQRLIDGDNYRESQLAKALRYCDGENLQCLMLIRDGFWLAMKRFGDALDMELVEGHNWQAVDLFDLDHARKVLAGFGQAYRRFPKADDVLNEEKAEYKNNREFLDRAVSQLAEGNYIICVRLALFAQMFRNRDWTPNELKAVGGVHGIGKTFLKETFDGGNYSNQRYLDQKESAQAILKALLPEQGGDIRGGIKPEAELKRAANLMRRDGVFQHVMKSLDQELKLVTQTNPDQYADDTFVTNNGLDRSEPDSLNELADINDLEKPNLDPAEKSGKSRTRFYQLTHDYLVSSIREWLSIELRKTPKGRAKLRLEEYSRFWTEFTENRFLPSMFEYLQIRCHVPRSELNGAEVALLGRANRFYSIRLACVAFLIFIATLSVGIARQQQNKKIANEYVDRFLTGHHEAVRSNVLLMNRYRSHSIGLLQERLKVPAGQEQNLRLHLGLSLLGETNGNTLTNLVDVISPNFDANSTNIIEALGQFPNSDKFLIERYEQLSQENDTLSLQCRARIAITLCFLGKTDWVAERIATETTDLQTNFVQGITSWHGNVGDVDSVLLGSSSEVANAVFCLAIGKLKNTNLINTSNVDKDLLTSRIAKLYANCDSVFLLSSAEWLLWQFDSPPQPRKDELSVDKKQVASMNSTTLRVNSIKMRMHLIQPRSVLLKAHSIGNFQELTEHVNYKFYSAEREVTIGDFELFLSDRSYQFEKPVETIYQTGDLESGMIEKRQHHPVTRISFVDAIMFCNWLSRKEGLMPCYSSTDTDYELSDTIKNNKEFMDNIKVPLNRWEFDNEADGFRLPTFAEWQCLEKDTQDYFYFGNKSAAKFANDYVWFAVNSFGKSGQPETKDVKQKMPNKNGLFDVYGNAAEYCWSFPFETASPTFRVYSRGNHFATTPPQLNPSKHDPVLPFTRSRFTGFRVVIGVAKTD